MLEQATPSVGSKVRGSPGHVELRFSERIEPAFSSVQVYNEAGQQVDKRDKHGKDRNPAALEVGVSPLTPGRYKVVWRAVSSDTHVTKGDFTFEVMP